MDSTAVRETTTAYAKKKAVHPNLYKVADVPVGGSAFYLIVKRLFDVTASFLAGVILLVPMLLVAAVIRMDSEGPALYRQERLGKGGKPFILYKFRSMRMDAEIDGPQWAKADDVRCTRIGRILRRTRMDELPQLWNIFKGEMSFVGPRPERACFYEEFETYIKGFEKRLQVTPGLTGLAQVNGGYDLEPEEKIVWDMKYIRTRGPWVDLQCLLKTVALVFNHKGAR